MMNDTELNIDELNAVAGGSSLREFPHYDKIKEFYKTRGMGNAFQLCRNYGLSVEESYAILSMIADDVKRGV